MDHKHYIVIDEHGNIRSHFFISVFKELNIKVGLIIDNQGEAYSLGFEMECTEETIWEVIKTRKFSKQKVMLREI